MKTPSHLICLVAVLLALAGGAHAGAITTTINAGASSFSYVQNLATSNAILSDMGFKPYVAYGDGWGGNHLYVNVTGNTAEFVLKFQTSGAAVISGGTISLNYWLTNHWASDGGSLGVYLWNNDPDFANFWDYNGQSSTPTATKYVLLNTNTRTAAIQNLTVNLGDYGITNTSNIVLGFTMNHNPANWTEWNNTEEFLPTSGSTPGLSVNLQIPEPATFGLLALGGLALLRRRRG